MTRVAVRIVKRADGFHVIGRRTTVVCRTFAQAWQTSVPYFAGRTR